MAGIALLLDHHLAGRRRKGQDSLLHANLRYI